MKSNFIYGLYRLTRANEYYGNNIALTILGTILNPKLSPIDFIVLFFANLLLTMFAFAINDIEDAEDDAKDPAKVGRNPISAKILTKPVSYVFTFLIGVLPLILLLPYGIYSLSLGVLTLVLGFLYSYKQIRLKSMPFLDLISHGLFLGTLELIIVLTAYNNTPSLISIIIALSIFTLSVIGDLGNEIRDFEVDRKTNIKNTASYINVKRVGKILHWFNLPPAIAIGVITLSLFGQPHRTMLFILAVLSGASYLYLERKHKGKIITKYAQEITTIFGLVLFISYFFGK